MLIAVYFISKTGFGLGIGPGSQGLLSDAITLLPSKSDININVPTNIFFISRTVPAIFLLATFTFG